MGLRCCLKIEMTGLGPHLPGDVSSAWRLTGVPLPISVYQAIPPPRPSPSLFSLTLSLFLPPSLAFFWWEYGIGLENHSKV